MNELKPITQHEIQAATVRVIRKTIIAMACLTFMFGVAMYLSVEADLAERTAAIAAVTVVCVVCIVLTLLCVRVVRRLSRAMKLGE